MIGYFVFSFFVVASLGSECNRICPLNYDPICANDGLTYDNLCQLEVANCLSRSHIRVLKRGECDETPKIKNGKECPRICQRNYDPVCGTDGKTYPNLCEMKSAACVLKSPIEVAKYGECEKTETSEDSDCESICLMINKPVCGSNGKTYANECFLKTEACLTKSHLFVAHNGEC